jgi:anaerobic magnesium-protoporphyrin IX monomethyl ester cyclase
MASNTVVLINPPVSLAQRYGSDMQKFGAVSEPLGLAYIAGYLEHHNVPVRIIDAAALNLTADQVVADLTQHQERVIGLTILTTTFSVVQGLCQKIRAAIPEALIVLGGPHVSALPERTLQEISHADVACMGEGEQTMLELARIADQADLSGLMGICFRRDDGLVVRNAERPFIKDLDTIPPPARHLLPIDKYHLTASRVSGSAFCPTIIVARGCPFGCTYCSRTFGRTFRAHSIERIMSEIEYLVETYDIRQLNIEADTLTVKKSFLRALCEAFIERGLATRIHWTCESRVDTVDADILALMRKAGCWQISYGVETGSQRLLDLINKGVTLAQVEQAFRLTKAVGISIRGFFMLGLPTETRSESMATIAFAKKLDPLWAQFTITVPYPGTAMFRELEAAGQIRTYDWRRYNTWSGWKGEEEIPFIPVGRSIEELADLQKRALRAFYLRPRVIWKFARTIRSIYDLQKYIQGFWVLIKSGLRTQRSIPN